MIRAFLISILIIFLPLSSSASQNLWPKIEMENTGFGQDACKDAFKIAKAQFHSNKFTIYRIVNFPNDVRSSPILIASGEDISGGDALKEASSVLEKIPKANKDGNFPRSIYWQKEPIHNLRFVVNEDAFGWRGDQYSLFAIDASISSKKFIAGYTRSFSKRVFTPIIEESWNPPQLMRQKNNQEIWAFSTGAPSGFLENWNVYSINTDGIQKRCSIYFRPNNKNFTDLLPLSVQKLSTLLNGTLGNGQNEGTLNPTARIRVSIRHVWANAALRPWALSDLTPYNNRKHVDQELQKWAQKAEGFNDLYRSIYKLYPKAELDLASYYQNEFNITSVEAKTIARETLDKAFRMHFVFSK